MANTVERADVEADIRKIVAEVLEAEPETVVGSAKFTKDLGMDSMMALEILAAIEKKYRIALPEESLPKFVSLDATVAIVWGILSKK
jgi:acyl carrier protein